MSLILLYIHFQHSIPPTIIGYVYLPPQTPYLACIRSEKNLPPVHQPSHTNISYYPTSTIKKIIRRPLLILQTSFSPISICLAHVQTLINKQDNYRHRHLQHVSIFYIYYLVCVQISTTSKSTRS
ncbi:hypothetical protein NQ318_008347 [Aromia moschata]|uniref:Uncharacterized protein n=1 Tax=Aromia moschata TaxID=1265417 RepID=A0AAV8YK58_9CUCU|nr:hypothetical protein NQ318_008347 [Aromia moschata]